MTVRELKELIRNESDDLEVFVEIKEISFPPEFSRLNGYKAKKQGKLLLLSNMIMDDDQIYGFDKEGIQDEKM